MEAITLNCIAIDDSRERKGDVFRVKVSLSDTIIELKAKILKEGPTEFERWRTTDLLLWRPKDDLAYDKFLSKTIQDWRLNFQTREEDNQAAIILDPLLTVASQFHLRIPLSSNSIHVVAQLSASEKGADINQLKVLAKRKHVELDDVVDEGIRVVERWRSKRPKTELPGLCELRSVADHPLSEEEKIPLSKKFMRSLISRELDNICTADDVALLFRASENGNDDIALIQFYICVKLRPPPEGSEANYHGFWDRNISELIEVILPNGKAQRYSNQNTAINPLKPDYAFLLNGFYPFRGEENNTGDPKAELAQKIEWVYNPLPYILGYYATGPSVTLAAITPPPPGGTRPVVHDIVHADLKFRKERVLNLRRLINLSGIIRTLAGIIV